MNERILLVDDESEIREILADQLEDEGYDVVQAEDGEVGFKIFMSEDIDLVVTDVRMPNKNGIELLKDIKQSGQDVDVIILTGQSDELTAIDCLRAGAYDYLLKPIEDLEIMVTSVSRALEKRSLTKKNKELMRQLEELAVRDPLTGLYNMRPFYQFVDSEIERSRDESHQFGVLFIDIDHFKKINDSYGHIFGDQVLKIFAKLLKSELKETAKLFRYGGEEFVAMLSETDSDTMLSIAKRLLEVVREYEFEFDGQKAKITISIGGAIYPSDAMEQKKLIQLADKALYVAKESGRNCYVKAETNAIYR
ncbi:TPA: diguanylate cyclase [Vibrio parahaemolyticus]|uniref:GGDEF domain-containing response regulator n=1 Tax=Vibrio vulnificus TaxID=672 RepID=UPI0032EB016B|nr:diguanylate cyclase [Vibrio parahaemolyticus]